MYGLKWKKSHNIGTKSVFMPKIYSKFFLYIDNLGIWIMNVSIENWVANQLTYKILDKLIEILEKTNNKVTFGMR